MISFIQLTTEVAPGAGSKLLAIRNDDGTYTQIVSIDTTPPVSSETAKFLDVTGVTTPGIDQTLIDDTVPVGKTRMMASVKVRCRWEGSFIILADGTQIGDGKTGPACPNAEMTWYPYRPVLSNQRIRVIFSAANGTRPGSGLSCYLQAWDIDN